LKKYAFFVEGQTEMLFLRHLLVNMAGDRAIAFHEEQLHAHSYIQLRSDEINGQELFALIVDCRSDASVVSAIRERHASLTAAGYEEIVGLRDLYPIARVDEQRLRDRLAALLPTVGAPVSLVLAIAEVEAWFVQEETHYERLSPLMTVQHVEQHTGFSFAADSAENLHHPAEWLDSVYQTAGMRYTKKRSRVERTLGALDFTRFQTDLPGRLPSLRELTATVDVFLSNS
jgi:hypothetical protein